MSASIILCDYVTNRIRHEDRGHSTPCWIWQQHLTPAGYAQGKPPGCRTARIMSRVSYEAFVGPIPDGLEIDHLCRVRSCCNPAHLEAVTHAENQRRVKWERAQVGRCLHGHPWTEENIKIDARGRRICRVCNDAWWARELQRRRDRRAEKAA